MRISSKRRQLSHRFFGSAMTMTASEIVVGVETAVPAPEHRLALAVGRVSVSAARAGLGRALRRDGDGGYAEFGGFLLEEFADVPDGRLGEAFVEFALRLGVLVGFADRAASGGHHADGVEAFYGDQLGLGFQQDVADLASRFLVAALGVAPCPFSVFGDCVSSFAVTGLSGDVSLVLPFAVAAPATALVVRSMSRADGQVVLSATVGAEDVLGFLDVQFFEGHRFWYSDLDVETVVPAA